MAGSLMLVAIIGWVLVGFGQVMWWAPMIPTLGLGGVVAAGRRIVLAQARADIARYGRVRSPQPGSAPARPQSQPGRPSAPDMARRATASSLPPPVAITEAELGAVLLAEGVEATDGLELVLDATDHPADAVSRPQTSDLAVHATLQPSAPPMPHTAAGVARGAGAAGLTQGALGDGTAAGTLGARAGSGAMAAGLARGASGGAAGVAGGTASDAGLAHGGLGEGTAGAEQDRGWTPPAVPAPTYTLREAADRREPKPLTEDDYEAAREAAARLTAAGPDQTGKIALPPRMIFGESTIDLDTAITKRRARA
jgi:hypothetical protein